MISVENGPFLVWKPDNLIVSHPIVTKLKMNDDIRSVTNPIWWCHHTGHGSLISGKNGPFWKRDNLIVSHPNVIKPNLNDNLGSVTNSIWWRHHWRSGFFSFCCNLKYMYFQWANECHMKGPKIVEVSYKEHASTSEPHKLSRLSMGTFRIVSPCKTLPRGAPFPTTALVSAEVTWYYDTWL